MAGDSRVLDHAGDVTADPLEQIGDVILYPVVAEVDVQAQIEEGGNVFFVGIVYEVFKLLEGRSDRVHALLTVGGQAFGDDLEVFWNGNLIQHEFGIKTNHRCIDVR